MSKNIKDYLHLYFGCEVIFGITENKRTGTFMGFADIDRRSAKVAFRAGPHGEIDVFFLRLNLRPLSDMTEDEAYEVDSEYGSVSGQHLSQALINNDLRYVKKLADGFELTRYLLSKHFDLFSLIECGLAIDASKLKVK